jgi:hypothetical protein
MFGGAAGPHDGDHVVSFYDNDDQLTATVTAYLAASVRDGDTVIVIATPEHRAAFLDALGAADVTPDYDRIQLLDAATALNRFMRDGLPDPGAFKQSVGQLLRVASKAGRPVRAYGEMVALLWSQGNRAGAVALEQLWNDLGAMTPFSLLCAYPVSIAADVRSADDVASLCHLHTEVDATIEASRTFDGSSAEVPDARAFVTEKLMQWGLGRLMQDCALIVSELTSNAVGHAHSPFTVRLLRVGDGVHVSVFDSSPLAARLQHPGVEQPHGRGLRVVATLAARWGQTSVDGGKRVWALVGAR